MKGLERTLVEPIKLFGNVVKRISAIEAGYSSPNHLKVDFSELLYQDLNDLKRLKIKEQTSVVTAKELLLRIEALFGRDHIIRYDFYKTLEYDREFHPDVEEGPGILIVDRGCEEYMEHLLETKQISASEQEILEKKVRAELQYYQRALVDLTGWKEKQITNASHLNYNGLMTDAYNDEKHINNIIYFSTSYGTRLFLYPKKDEFAIQSLFRCTDLESLSQKHKKISLGMPVKYAMYFFEQLKKKAVIIKRYKAFFEKSNSICSENSLLPLTSDLMRKELHKILSNDKSNRINKNEVTKHRVLKEINDYINLHF